MADFSLPILSLSHNFIDKEGAMALSEAVREMANLQVLK